MKPIDPDELRQRKLEQNAFKDAYRRKLQAFYDDSYYHLFYGTCSHSRKSCSWCARDLTSK